MIQPNELRIGNLFLHEGTILSCNGVADSDHENEGIVWYGNELGFYVTFNEATPIPITKELLLRLGFQEDISRKWLHNTNFYPISYNVRTGKILLYSAEVPINAVHQLQNLWYSITGKELELKQTEPA